MNTLLIIAHGSRNPQSNKETATLTDAIRSRKNNFDIIDYAFLELAEPGISASVSSLANRGAKKISVLPLFLAKGNHMVRDIPEKIKTVCQEYPDIEINMLPHIGAADEMPDLILRHLTCNS